jgi:CDP-glycerol glycerophosphotransferase
MEKISVIVPVYNTEKYVADCINSLLEQTYKHIEIILVDDSSHDLCKQLLEVLSKKDHRIVLYHLRKKGGVGAARNYGVKKANGDYIYFMDSDDYLPEKTLEILIKNIKDYSMIRGQMKETDFSNGMAIVFDGLFKLKLYTDNRYNLIKNNSALHFLFEKKFVLDHALKFSEDVEVYSDLAFMIPALINADQIPHVKEAVYFRRRRNDPIGNPSLRQLGTEIKLNNFLCIYTELKEKYMDSDANNFLDAKLLNFYRKTVVTHFKDNARVDLHFEQLSEAVRKIQPDVLNVYDVFLKKEINALGHGDIHRYKKVNARHHLLRDLRRVVKSKRNLYEFIYKRIFMKSQLKQKLVFFESFQGRSYSDSPKYIYEYMLNKNMDYKYVWCTNERQDIPGNPIQVKRLSLQYYYYLAKARFWVSNARMPNNAVKREGTTYLQTWHGTPLKQLAADMEDVHMPGTNSAKYKRNFFNETQKWDYLIAPNAYSAGIFKRAFWFSGTMIESGYPRNDILYNESNEKSIMGLKEKMNIPQDKKVILYGPTWRDDEYYGKGKYKFTLKLDLAKMQQQLGDEYVVLLRMHYVIASQMDISDFVGFAYDFSSYNDVGELYLISDILITDYSSVFFDFANLKRPILFYTYDLEKYRDQLRGFYIDIEKELPGPLLMSTDEVTDAIINIDNVQNEYAEKYDAFYDRFCNWDDGYATEKAVKKVFQG